MPSFDLLVIGDLNPDVMLSADDLAGDLANAFGQREQIVQTGRMLLGGSSAITAVAAARLGLRVAFACCVGDDWIGRALIGEVTGQGVTVVARQAADLPTALTVILTRGADRAILTTDGTLRSLTCDDIPADLVEDCRHVHVGAYFLQPNLWPGLPDLFLRARKAGATTSIDPNWDPSEQWTAGLAETLPLVNIFLPNAAEARLITGLDEPDAAARHLAQSCELVAVKAGPNGALVCRGDVVERVETVPLQAKDTIGAGDNFDAGFLTGRLSGLGLRDSLALAIACGGLSTQGIGGTGATINIDQARAAAGLTPGERNELNGRPGSRQDRHAPQSTVGD